MTTLNCCVVLLNVHVFAHGCSRAVLSKYRSCQVTDHESLLSVACHRRDFYGDSNHRKH